jgi:soluble lytic murein transglycosylase-like protein/pSer/pThr/pTyr-binding forkhead associated (FHA) protein
LTDKSYSLGPGEYFYIGSHPTCTIKLTDDPTVSEVHACIFYDPNGKILFKDLGSKFGCMHNGRRLKGTIKVRAGDRITIGQFATFQSSWWNALQATKLTRFTGLRRAKRQSSLLSSNLVQASMASLVVFLAAGIGYKIVRDKNNDSSIESEYKPTEVAGNHKKQNALKFNARLKKSGNKELTPERGFIWDEIVAISRRFGEPPPTALDLAFVREVEFWIQRFTKNNRHRIVLERKKLYWPMIEEKLTSKGLPVELGYVAWVESHLDPVVVSHAGAAGLWQIMPETAMEYGLTVTAENDERFDPTRSTDAASDYFITLLRMFGSERYLLALASYNTGQNRVQRMQLGVRVGKGRTSDFWQIRDLLSKETAEYVPKVMAAIIIGRNPERWGPAPH